MPIIDKRGTNRHREYQIIISYIDPLGMRTNYPYWCVVKSEKEARMCADTFARELELEQYQIEKIQCQS